MRVVRWSDGCRKPTTLSSDAVSSCVETPKGHDVGPCADVINLSSTAFNNVPVTSGAGLFGIQMSELLGTSPFAQFLSIAL